MAKPKPKNFINKPTDAVPEIKDQETVKPEDEVTDQTPEMETLPESEELQEDEPQKMAEEVVAVALPEKVQAKQRFCIAHPIGRNSTCTLSFNKDQIITDAEVIKILFKHNAPVVEIK